MNIGPSTLGQFLSYIRADIKYAAGRPLKRFLERYIFEPGFRYIFWLRLTRLAYLYQPKGILYLLPGFLLKQIGYKYGFDISFRAQIGPGLTIAHYGYIIVTSDTQLGSNCTLRPGVVFGKKLTEDRHGCTVGNNVSFGVGSKIIGKIQIGDNVFVGANAVITKDVPSNCVVAGVPAKIIKSLK